MARRASEMSPNNLERQGFTATGPAIMTAALMIRPGPATMDSILLIRQMFGVFQVFESRGAGYSTISLRARFVVLVIEP
jgi:hypothetical protein